MTRIIEIDNCGNRCVTDNDELLSSVLADITRNNTTFPEVIDLYEYKKDCKVKVPKMDKSRHILKDKDGNTLYETTHVKKDALRVRFADDTWTDVVRSEDDKYDRVTAILYAIVKRLYGIPTEAGYVVGNGFMGYLKDLTKHVRSEETEAEEKAKRLKEKELADKKAHEEAVKRRENNPSLGIRLNSLERKFQTLCDILEKNSKKK